jgi:hypothetical protein
LFSEKSLDTPAISWILATHRQKQQTGQTLTAPAAAVDTLLLFDCLICSVESCCVRNCERT